MAIIEMKSEIVQRKQLPWSEKQRAIFKEIEEGNGSLIIEACAGGAKTTSILESMNYIKAGKRAIFVAFNKSIADELANKVPSNTTASTLHGVGYQAMRSLGWFKVNGSKTRNILMDMVDMENQEQKAWMYENLSDICRCISMAKGSLSPLREYELKELAIDRLMMDDSFYLSQYLYPTYLKSMEFQAGVKGKCVIDFDDMLRIPLLQVPSENFPKYDFVFVDEAQDLNEIQRLICEKLLLPGGRLVAVGDRKQAIYGFRGADYTSLDAIASKFQCKSLPLDVSYRCSLSVVEEAQSLYEDIHPREGAPVGSISILPESSLYKEIRGGDMILCRINAPLISQAMYCLQEGKPVCVLGNDLPAMLDKHAKACVKWGKKSYNSMTDSLHSNLVETYFLAKINETESKYKIAYLEDMRDTFLSLLPPGFTTVDNFKKRVESLFTAELPKDREKYIIFCSIHKSKGLEAERVFILHPENMPHKMAVTQDELIQEKNLHYVAITRAKIDLVYTTGNGYPYKNRLIFNYGGEFSGYKMEKGKEYKWHGKEG